MTTKQTVLALLGGLIVVSIVLGFAVGFVQGFRAVWGAVLIVALPGAAWSYALWPTKRLAPVFRAVVSLFLSVVLVSLTVFFANRLGMPLTPVNAALCAAALAAAGYGLWRLRTQVGRRRS